MSKFHTTFFRPRGLRHLVLGVTVLGACLSLAAPSFKDIQQQPLVTEAPAAAVDAETRQAFNDALAACRDLARGGQAAEADTAFQALVQAQTDEALRVQALEAYALFLYNDSARARDADALDAFGRLLAIPGRPTTQVKSWLGLKQAIHIRQQQHAETFETSLALLALPGLGATETASLKRQAVQALAASGRAADAVALAREVVQDADAPIDLRSTLGRSAAGWLQRTLEQPEEAEALLDDLLRLPLDASQRTAVRYDLLQVVARAIKPRNLDAVEARALALIDDPEATAWLRGRAAGDLLGTFYGERATEQKARPVPVVERLLAQGVLPIAEEVRLRENLQRTLRALGRRDAELDQARVIMTATNAPAASRVTACVSLAQPLVDREDYAAAEEHLRQAFAFAGLDPAAVAQIVEAIGRLYLLREQVEQAGAIYREAYRFFATPEMTNRVVRLTAAALAEDLRFEDAARLWLDCGGRLEAAEVLDAPASPFAERARELRLQVLEDASAPLETRATAYLAFLTHDPRDVPVAEKHHELFIRANTNRAISTFVNRITWNGRGTAYFGNFEGTLRYLGWLKPLVKPNLNYRTTVCAINAYAGLGRLDEAAALAREALDYAGFKPQETYQIRLTSAALEARAAADSAACAAALARAEMAAGKALGLSPADRAAALALAGATVLQGNLETVARAVASLREGLYAPQPKKRYKVSYSARPITGIDTWDGAVPSVERQLMDRGYGGNMEFLVTDVATGNRGEGIGTDSAAAQRKPAEIAFVCDVNGLHIRIDAYDEQAAAVKAKLLGAGSYEGYIAPGENQPYICFLIDAQSGKFSFYNTTYDNQFHRRLNEEEISLWRGEHRFREDGYTTYLFLSWEVYAEKIPEAGAIWDFENVHWSRSGSFSWNGLKSIHGRSSWGELEFDIPAAGRTAIHRQLIFSALARYKSEKRTSHHHEGVLDHWLDPVVGDPAFYEDRLRPLVERLDALVPLVKADMSDADVARVRREALFGWNNLQHVVAEERRKYLAAQLMQADR